MRFANLPFVAVGGIGARWLRGLHLCVSASSGFVALFGVAVLPGVVVPTVHDRMGRRTIPESNSHGEA